MKTGGKLWSKFQNARKRKNDPDAASPSEAASLETPRTIKLRKHEGQATELSFAKGLATKEEIDSRTSIERLIHALGSVFYNTLHESWLSVSDVNDMLDHAFATLEQALAEHAEITFSVSEGNLLVNREACELTTQTVRSFVAYLNDRNANHFTFLSGMTRDEFNRFLSIATLRTDQLEARNGFYTAVSSEQFKFVRALKVSFLEVTEDETVLSKRELERKLAEARLQAELDMMALLSGEKLDDEVLAAERARKVTVDPARTAGLILEAADNESAAQGREQPISVAVVVCLRRAFNGLMKDPALETQKGKKSLIKTLGRLEKEILLRLGDTQTAADRAAVSEAFDALTDELRIDAIASEYAKRLKAIEQSEKRILRFIKQQGIDALENSDLALRLSEAGLDVSGWHALLAKSEASADDREVTEEVDATQTAVETLARLIAQLHNDSAPATETQASDIGQDSGGLAGHVAQIEREVMTLTAATEDKIARLFQQVHSDGQRDRKRDDADDRCLLPRDKLLERLAEIVQELCQPLSVINCSIHVISKQLLGSVTERQLSMLKLAADSAARIEGLMVALRDVSGLPSGLTPDNAAIDTLYDAGCPCDGG